MLTEEQITEFQEIYKRVFGEEISRAKALEEGIRLVSLMKIIYKPITKEEFKELQGKREKE